MQDELRAAVLGCLRNAAYRAAKPRQIAERLGLYGDAAEEVRKVIKRMAKDGEVRFGPNHLVLPADPNHPSHAALLGGAARAAAKTAPAPESAVPESAVPEARDAGADLRPAPREEKPRLVGREGRRSRDGEDGVAAAPDQKPASRGERGGGVLGLFRRIGSGDGFVRPEGTPREAGRDDDVFVAARDAHDASSGDTVRIVVSSHRGPRGKLQGKVVDVVERATNQFVGSYFEAGGLGLVRIDGDLFGAPVYVGDPGAKGLRENDKVVVEMVRFPTHQRDGEAVVTRVLGERGQPGVDTLAIKYEFGLPDEFPTDVLEESRAAAAAFDESIGPDREDLTGEVVVTIDPATARDFDDAISLRKNERGHWELGVHIADVSHFVRPKTPLDREAYQRATSVYLPDEVIPMLPELISNNLASLQPGRVRYAMTARVEFTADGAPVAADVFKSAIRSRRRFTYEEIDQYLAAKGLVKREGVAAPDDSAGVLARLALTPEVDALLAEMFALAMLLRKRRRERGALELSMPEVKVDLDAEGRVCGAHVEPDTESHQVIEEFMLSANEAVARRLAEAGLVFLRRVHGDPDPRKLKALTEFVRSLGLPAENLQNRFELQALLDSIRDDPRRQAVNFAALRSMQKAIYSPEDAGHYALASDDYCHFTSPIRRYPDLTVHRLLDDMNRGRKPRQEFALLVEQGDHCSEREQRAADAERELTKVKLLSYLADKIGLELEGVVTGVENFGMFVLGKELPAEGLVHISALADDFYRFDRATHTISGQRAGRTFRLGDELRVAVAAVDVDARKLELRYLGRVGEKSRPTKPLPGRGRGPAPRGGPRRKGRPGRGR